MRTFPLLSESGTNRKIPFLPRITQIECTHTVGSASSSKLILNRRQQQLTRPSLGFAGTTPVRVFSVQKSGTYQNSRATVYEIPTFFSSDGDFSFLTRHPNE